jgi:L-amino acid N-acyltransferase YncA
MLIRTADPARDAASCADIYAPFVRDSAVSFEYEPPDEGEFASRISRASETHAWVVAEDDAGAVVGFAYGGPHRLRAAYRWAAEVAIYIDPDHHGKGVGRALYTDLFTLLGEQGYRMACAGIALPNDASIGLHRALGFESVGVYRRIGWKAGAWWDVHWWQRELGEEGERDSEPQPEPGPQAGAE